MLSSLLAEAKYNIIRAPDVREISRSWSQGHKRPGANPVLGEKSPYSVLIFEDLFGAGQDSPEVGEILEPGVQ